MKRRVVRAFKQIVDGDVEVVGKADTGFILTDSVLTDVQRLLKGNAKVSYTKTGLTKGKTYYFKVAAYSAVGGKNIFSSFSSVKYAKVK